MDDSKFREKISLISDAYFDREFFTNLIYCIDRKKTIREVFEAVVHEISTRKSNAVDIDDALLHLFYSYQTANSVKENYQWLPLAQGIYTLSLYRSEGQKPVGESHSHSTHPAQAATLQEFSDFIRTESRGVESFRQAWGSLLFLLDNRSTRGTAVSIFLKQAFTGTDLLSFQLCTKALEMALASGWRSNANLLLRAFERFWHSRKPSNLSERGLRLASTSTPSSGAAASAKAIWNEDWTEEMWKRISGQSAESAWEFVNRIVQEGASVDQIFALLQVFRGRCLFAMKAEQWTAVSSSIVLADALQAASRLSPEHKWAFLASDILDLVQVAQLVSVQTLPELPTGEGILDGISKNIPKDRLILRLDDAVERGRRTEALEILAVILKDQGLSHSLADRLLLIASKQDGWTYNMKTIPTALLLTRAFSSCRQLQVSGRAVDEGLYGLLRFLSDQREGSLRIVPKTGTYGDGLPLSQYDVSGGARIVDRFIFNQLRNGQRIKVWPSDN